MMPKSFGNSNFMQSTGRLNMHSWWALFFPFEGWAGTSYFLSFFLVPNVFSTCSFEIFQIPKFFPKVFWIAPQFYPIRFTWSSALMYINWKGKPLGDTFAYILQLMVQRGASIGECLMFPKNCSWANEYGSLKKKRLWAHPWTN
jgi:hypothetical protein